MKKRRVNIQLYTRLKEIAGRGSVTVEGDNLQDCVEVLCAQLGANSRDLVIQANGLVRASFQVCLNTEMIDPKKLATTPFEDGDTLHLMPPIAGGSDAI